MDTVGVEQLFLKNTKRYNPIAKIVKVLFLETMNGKKSQEFGSSWVRAMSYILFQNVKLILLVPFEISWIICVY